VPTVSCCARHTALPKKVSVSRPVPSVTTTSPICLPFLVGRTELDTTSAITVACSPTTRSESFVSSPRSAYRRG
jgi:hypothetical protein